MKLKIVLLILKVIFLCLFLLQISTLISILGIVGYIVCASIMIFCDARTKKDGEIHIIDTDEKTTWKFELTSDPEKIRGQKTVTFGVKDSSS